MASYANGKIPAENACLFVSTAKFIDRWQRQVPFRSKFSAFEGPHLEANRKLTICIVCLREESDLRLGL